MADSFTKLIANTINPNHKIFINQYITNGYNALRAYMSAYPECKRNSAASCAYPLLDKLGLRELVNDSINETVPLTITTKDKLQHRFEQLADKAEGAEEFAPAVKALENVGKLRRYYSEEESQVGQFNAFIENFTLNKLTVNNIDNNEEDKSQVIDITE